MPKDTVVTPISFNFDQLNQTLLNGFDLGLNPEIWGIEGYDTSLNDGKLTLLIYCKQEYHLQALKSLTKEISAQAQHFADFVSIWCIETGVTYTFPPALMLLPEPPAVQRFKK